MDSATLKQLMDPEFQVAQAKYESYRIAVDKAYKMAEGIASYSDFNFVKEEEGKRLYEVNEPTPEGRATQVITIARVLLPAIYEDLSKAIALLDKKGK